jgi:pimeloyl-ACP methyl ester carboxylesterase
MGNLMRTDSHGAKAQAQTQAQAQAQMHVRAQPFFFGPDGQRLFGWFHPARGPVSRSCAIVVCPPLGHEYAWTHRSLRRLADRLAGEGFSVMRFDYQGTGDSCGNPEDPGQLAGWLWSVREAVARTRQLSGTGSISLIGLRLGATLAMADAARHGDISSVVLWAPYMSGNEYLRELRILQAMTKQPSAQETIRSETMDYGAQGFLLTADAADELRDLDLMQVGRPAPDVLVIPRDDRPRAHQPLVDHISRNGARVQELCVPGTTAMLVEPVRSLVPDDVLDSITRWLSSIHPPMVSSDLVLDDPNDSMLPASASNGSTSDGTTSTAISDSRSYTLASGIFDSDCSGVEEVPVQFGGHPHGDAEPDRFTGELTNRLVNQFSNQSANLFGIVTLPRQSQDSGARPAVVFLNTGADHHVGPNRMYVPMARELANMGFLSFRFDLAGLGDSSPSRGEEHVTYPNGAVQDIAQAIDMLRAAYGVERVVLVGLCSGAYFAIRAALAELPVAMCMAINPPLYSDNGRLVEPSKLRNYSDVVLLREAPWARKRWLKPFGGPLGLKDVLAASQIKTSVTVQRVRSGMGIKSNTEGRGVGALLESLCDRGVDVFILFAHGERARTDLELQLGWQLHALQGHRNFHFGIIDGAGHGFRPVHAQQQLRRMLIEHVLERYGDLADAGVRDAEVHDSGVRDADVHEAEVHGADIHDAGVQDG